jgi:hypothetical protein
VRGHLRSGEPTRPPSRHLRPLAPIRLDANSIGSEDVDVAALKTFLVQALVHRREGDRLNPPIVYVVSWGQDRRTCWVPQEARSQPPTHPADKTRHRSQNCSLKSIVRREISSLPLTELNCHFPLLLVAHFWVFPQSGATNATLPDQRLP